MNGCRLDVPEVVAITMRLRSQVKSWLTTTVFVALLLLIVAVIWRSNALHTKFKHEQHWRRSSIKTPFNYRPTLFGIDAWQYLAIDRVSNVLTAGDVQFKEFSSKFGNDRRIIISQKFDTVRVPCTVSQNSHRTEDHPVLSSWWPISLLLSTARRLRCTLTMFRTAGYVQLWQRLSLVGLFHLQSCVLWYILCQKIHKAEAKGLIATWCSYGS